MARNTLPTDDYPTFIEPGYFDSPENKEDLFLGRFGMGPDDSFRLTELGSP
jgi:hypothetical protein